MRPASPTGELVPTPSLGHAFPSGRSARVQPFTFKGVPASVKRPPGADVFSSLRPPREHGGVLHRPTRRPPVAPSQRLGYRWCSSAILSAFSITLSCKEWAATWRSPHRISTGLGLKRRTGTAPILRVSSSLRDPSMIVPASPLLRTLANLLTEGSVSSFSKLLADTQPG